MTTPRNYTQAVAAGYVTFKIYAAGSKKCRIDLKPRFYNNGMKAVLSYWMDSKRFKKAYPQTFENNAWY